LGANKQILCVNTELINIHVTYEISKETLSESCAESFFFFKPMSNSRHASSRSGFFFFLHHRNSVSVGDKKKYKKLRIIFDR
jgi:hypothetical protein